VKHSKVTKVYYPGLPEHAGHEVAASRCGASAAWCVRVAGGEQVALDICAKTKLFTLAESLGGIESLIEHPAR